MRKKIAAWIAGGIDVLYPRVCPGCGREAGETGRYVCWDCLSRMPFVSHPFCSRCGQPVAGKVDRAYECSLCHADPPAFARARVAARFEDPTRGMLHDLKYGGATWLAPDLAEWLAVAVRAFFADCRIDALTAVPLYPGRYRMRGYNQADLLARHAGRLLGIPVLPDIVARAKDTRSQTGLTASERKSNVHRAFTVPRPDRVSGLAILCIDDVMTTGATLNACASVLKRAGASCVYAAAVARG